MEKFPKLAGYKMQSLMQKVRLSLATKLIFVSEEAWRIQDSNCYKQVSLYTQVQLLQNDIATIHHGINACLLQTWNPRCNFYKEEYQLQIIQLQNATKWVLVLTYLSKIQKKCYYKMTIGYGPIAVCYKMATDPNLKTSNWLKTAGCTYHKSTHSVVEIRTGI